jgi:hypothetical protein
MANSCLFAWCVFRMLGAVCDAVCDAGQEV